MAIPLHLALQAQVPNITTPPQSVYITVGNTHTLTVEAESTDGGTLTYQWYSNTSASNEGGTAIGGATSNSYTTPALTDEKSYYYYAVITNTTDYDAEVDVKTASIASTVATLEVTTEQTYTVTVSSIATGASGSGTYLEGVTVNIHAGTAPTGMQFKNWTASVALEDFDANKASTSFTMPANDVTVTANFDYLATLNVMKDGTAWNGHGKNFILKFSDNESLTQAMTGEGATLTASVSSGSWKVYDGETYTDVTIVAGSSATVNYYTVKYRVVNGDGAFDSNISATCNGSVIATDAVVLSGSTVTITAAGADPDKNTYTYAWSGTATGTDASYTTTVEATVDAICTVTGSSITNAENPQFVNPLKAWTNNGILHVSGLTEGKVWNLYNASGALVKQGVADSDVVTISLELSGMYIIQSEGKTLKLRVEN